MTRDRTDQGQRVNTPTGVSGDTPTAAEPELETTKKEMAEAAKGIDTRLKKKEAQAGRAFQTGQRGNDAGE